MHYLKSNWHPTWLCLPQAAWTGMAIMLFLFAATEFSIAVSVSHVGCQATCCGLQNAVSILALSVGPESEHVLKIARDVLLLSTFPFKRGIPGNVICVWGERGKQRKTTLELGIAEMHLPSVFQWEIESLTNGSCLPPPYDNILLKCRTLKLQNIWSLDGTIGFHGDCSSFTFKFLLPFSGRALWQ